MGNYPPPPLLLGHSLQNLVPKYTVWNTKKSTIIFLGSEMTPPLSDFCQKKNIHIYMVWLIWRIQRITHIEKSIFIINDPLLLAAGRELFFMSMRVKFEYTGPFKTPWHTKCKLYLNSLAIQIFTKKTYINVPKICFYDWRR